MTFPVKSVLRKEGQYSIVDFEYLPSNVQMKVKTVPRLKGKRLRPLIPLMAEAKAKKTSVDNGG